jgi:hypothetical protein
VRINTRLDRIELTKSETKSLETAKALLVKLAKHGDGILAEASDAAADAIGVVLGALKGELTATK